MLTPGWQLWFSHLQMYMGEALGEPERGIAFALFKQEKSVGEVQEYLMARRGHKTHSRRGRPRKARPDLADIRSEEDFQAALEKQLREDEDAWNRTHVDEMVAKAMDNLSQRNRPHLRMPAPIKYEMPDADFDFDPPDSELTWHPQLASALQDKPKAKAKKPRAKVKTVDTNVTRRIDLDE